ncbi:hypothetical protein CGQ25_13850 [Sinomonas sp. R1AF57]|nr:hypothetical protein CGQ25_13850 [Sinomonas sp. R1AF57]
MSRYGVAIESDSGLRICMPQQRLIAILVRDDLDSWFQILFRRLENGGSAEGAIFPDGSDYQEYLLRRQEVHLDARLARNPAGEYVRSVHVQDNRSSTEGCRVSARSSGTVESPSDSQLAGLY